MQLYEGAVEGLLLFICWTVVKRAWAQGWDGQWGVSDVLSDHSGVIGLEQFRIGDTAIVFAGLPLQGVLLKHLRCSSRTLLYWIYFLWCIASPMLWQPRVMERQGEEVTR